MKHSTNLITIEIGLNHTYLETNLYTGGHTIFFIVDPQLQKSGTQKQKNTHKSILLGVCSMKSVLVNKRTKLTVVYITSKKPLKRSVKSK